MVTINKIKSSNIIIKRFSDIEDTTLFGRIVSALEGGADDSNPITISGNTLSVGGALNNVSFDSGAESPVTTTWINLGYNKSIPEYVKYRRVLGIGYKHVWVRSVKSGFIAPISVGDTVYVRSFNSSTLENDYVESIGDGTIAAVGEETFTYGNNSTYSVPMSITTSQGEYTFCGYNITLQSKALLGLQDNGAMYHLMQFNPNQNPTWSDSHLRSWMNGKGPAYSDLSNASITSVDQSVQAKTLGDFASLNTRFGNRNGFDRNIVNTVNRIAVNTNFRTGKTLDSNGCEHVSDRWWLLGAYGVNCSGNYTNSYLNFGRFDTSIFSGVFNNSDIWTDEPSRVKYLMNSDGSTGSTPDYWWLDTARNGNVVQVASVRSTGYAGELSATTNNHAISPVCQIG